MYLCMKIWLYYMDACRIIGNKFPDHLNFLSCHVTISDFYLLERTLAAYLVTIWIWLLNKMHSAERTVDLFYLVHNVVNDLGHCTIKKEKHGKLNDC